MDMTMDRALWADGQTDRQIYEEMDRHRDRQTDRCTERHNDGQTDRKSCV